MRRLIFLILALVPLGAACNRQTDSTPARGHYSDGVIKLAGQSINYELAADSISRQKGLSDRISIEENQGMLFQFESPEFLAFWMKDMNFPIDMVWINGDHVIDITAEAPPEPGVAESQLKVYSPHEPADRVLELKSGWAGRKGLKIGDKIEISRMVQ